MAASTEVGTTLSAITFLFRNSEKGSFVDSMMKDFEEEERLDEIAMSRVKYPKGANMEQKGYIQDYSIWKE